MNAQTDLPIGPVKPKTGPQSKLGGASTLSSVGVRWGTRPPDQIISRIHDDLATLLDQIRAINTHLTTDLTIPLMMPSGGNHQAGAVPDPGATAGTSKFLREDATFASPLSGAVLATYASNAAALAGGLVAGDFYTDGSGAVKVVF